MEKTTKKGTFLTVGDYAYLTIIYLGVLAALVFSLSGCGTNTAVRFSGKSACTISNNELLCPNPNEYTPKDGANGKDGAKGEKGDKGDQGEQGAQGLAGNDGQDGVDGQDGTDGVDGEDGEDGEDADTQLAIVEIINPCGDAPGIYDEVFLKLGNGTVVASFSNNVNGDYTRFSVLPAGTYSTTDADNCVFSINSLGVITYENHHY